MLRRVLAVLVLVLVALVAIRLVIGLVAGLVLAVLWILVVTALVAAGLWARSTLKSAKRRRGVEPSPSAELAAAPLEDRVAADMRRITEHLREQGRI
jgi:predicted cobalt transporter CbtA